MIINIDREPKYSLYYIGGIILDLLKNMTPYLLTSFMKRLNLS